MMPIYHSGEVAVQDRAGVRDEAARIGRSIRSLIPAAAEELLRRQPMVILATADTHGRMWASIVTGQPGFLRAEDEGTLLIAARPTNGDPLVENIVDGAHVGVLVIDLAIRRRIRLNGVTRGTDGTTIRVFAEQVYSNCPKYIQARSLRVTGEPRTDGSVSDVRITTSLTEEQRRWIESADTFFIASNHPEAGADASHRGGPPGFVKVTGGRRLTWGDYAGNNMFQTLGNISVNPRVGVLFVDFERGGTLQLTGAARILWDPERAATVPGALRLVEFDLEEAIETSDATSLRWVLLEASPFNPRAAP